MCIRDRSKGNYCEAHALQVLHHLHSAPTVEGDLSNIEPLTQLLDEFLNVAVVAVSYTHLDVYKRQGQW